MAADESKEWSITTRRTRPIRDIARDLAEAGLHDVQILEETGIITGSATDEAAARLRKVSGVRKVESTPGPDIGPPNEEFTW